MQTLKWLKISFRTTVIYCFICILSVGLIAYGVGIYSLAVCYAGTVLMYGWLVNPMGIVVSVIGMVHYNREKRSPEYRGAIGRKWIWFLVHMTVDAVFWVGAGAMAAVYF